MNDININKNFLIVGCGGLGCFLVEGLVRLGVKSIKVCDPDTFSNSNLNRQLYSTNDNLGKEKVLVAEKRAKELGYEGEFIAIPKSYEKPFLENVDIVIDALDNIKTRLILEDDCKEFNIPIIHGAVEGDYYQVGVSLPNSNLLHNIYNDSKEPTKKETNVITVMSCAAKQLSILDSELKEYFEVFEI